MAKKNNTRRKKIGIEQRRMLFDRMDDIFGMEENQWRLDCDERIVEWNAYGNERSQFGGNIHHINGNRSQETINSLGDNLEPVHFETHRHLHKKDLVLMRVTKDEAKLMMKVFDGIKYNNKYKKVYNKVKALLNYNKKYKQNDLELL